MTRLRFDPASGLLAAESALFAPAASEVGRGPAGSFDQHLRRAREAVAPDAESPPGAAESPGPARPEPTAPGGDPTSPSSPLADAPARPAEDRDDEQEADRASLPHERSVSEPADRPADKAPSETACAGAIAAASAEAPSDGRRRQGDPATDGEVAKSLKTKPSGPEHAAPGARPKRRAVSEATARKTPSPEKQPAGKRTVQPGEAQEEPDGVQAEQPANEPDVSQASAGPARQGKAVKETGRLAGAEAGTAESSAATANASLSLDQERPEPSDNHRRTQPAEGAARRSAARPSSRSPGAAGAAKVVRGDAPAASDPVAAEGETPAPDALQAVRPDSSVSPEPLAAPRERSDKVDAPAAKAEVDVARVQAATDKQISPGSGPARAGDGAQAPGAEQAERVQFIQRVARAFEAAADRGGTLRLRLHPPELGSLRLELSLRRGAMTARLETETEAARTMLLDNLPALRQRLAEHQIRVERFDVQWTGPSAGDLPGQADRHARWQASGTRHTAPAGTRADEPPANPAPVRSPARPGQGAGFDVIV